MRLPLLSAVCAASTFFALATSASAQVGTLTTVSGKILDLSVDGSGRLLYCTEQGDVGRITTTGSVTVLATAATGPFVNQLRGVVETPTGDIAVIDSVGDIYKLPAGATPAVKIYSDYFLINDPTSLLVDASGNFVTTSLTPTSGVRAIDWVSADGSRWAYYLVKHTPVGAAFDPTTGSLLFSDTASGGAIRGIDVTDESHTSFPVETTQHPGYVAGLNDGDLAVDANGNVLSIAGGKLWRLNRTTGVSTTLATGLQQLRGLAIAASSGAVASASGWSAYLAEGANPTSIREVGNVGAPASVTAASMGTVPGPGKQLSVFSSMLIYNLTTDAAGNLLFGGSTYGSNPSLKRISLPTPVITTVAQQSNGIAGQIEGICARQDGSIYVLTSDGIIQKVTESPLTVTTVFADPLNQVVLAKNLAMMRDGTFYIANRTDYGSGNVIKVAPNGSSSSVFAATAETHGIINDPFSGQLMIAQWNNAGFVGEVDLLHPTTGVITPIPGFSTMNFANGGVWPDGKLVEDVEGNIYTCSEDDFSVHRFNRTTGKMVRIGSGYVFHPSGVAIARSSTGTASTTGWSLYVSEQNYFWEIADVPAPASAVSDPTSPNLGRLVGYLSPTNGFARAVVADPQGNGFYVATSNPQIVRIGLDGSRVVVAAPAQGLTGDLVAIAAAPNGHLVTVNRGGIVFDVDPNNAFVATVVYANAPAVLHTVRGLAVDGLGRALLSDSQTGANAGRLYRLSGGVLELLTFTNRGAGAAIDPLTGDLFIPEQGTASANGGEILRVDAFATPAAAGHYRGDSYFTLPFGTNDGSIAFNAAGDFVVSTASDGLFRRVQRATGTRSVVAGNLLKPTGAVIAPGHVGIAGAQGSSLFILEGAALFEVGIAGLPPGPAPVSNPGLAPSADVRVSGVLTLGSTLPISIQSAPNANQVYLLLPTFSGKSPGLAINLFGQPEDPRVIPWNPDDTCGLVNTSVLPDWYGVLDSYGMTPPTTSIVVPNQPSILIGQFLDLTWIALDYVSMSGIPTIGGTAQVYVGN